jgi:4'-phosphopantetheinyl transferase
MSTGIPPSEEVHLWWASLAVDDAELVELEAVLNDRERVRAERFTIERARRRFTAARGFLRVLLARVTGGDPAEVTFSYGVRGKPALDGAPKFNASDSGDTVVVALAAAEVGVDLEVIRPLSNPDRLARRIATRSEVGQLEALPDDELENAVHRLWTYKEAALKAAGTGLPGGLHNVEIDLESVPPRLRRLLGDRDGWTLLTSDFDPSVLCSIVVRGPITKLRNFRFELG